MEVIQVPVYIAPYQGARDELRQALISLESISAAWSTNGNQCWILLDTGKELCLAIPLSELKNKMEELQCEFS